MLFESDQIIKRFSVAANTYNESADVQRYVADLLFRRIEYHNNRIGEGPVLECGCGSGLLTRRLLGLLPARDIVSFDISPRMIDVARSCLCISDQYNRQVDFFVSDMRCPAIDTSTRFPIIVSNGALQWAGDPLPVLSCLMDILSDKGVICMSTFGPETLYELRWAMSEFMKGDISLASSSFADRSCIGKSSKLFSDFYINEVVVRRTYRNLYSLFKRLKNTGTNIKVDKALPKVFTPKMLHSIEQIYKERFGKISATYQIFFCEAIR